MQFNPNLYDQHIPNPLKVDIPPLGKGPDRILDYIEGEIASKIDKIDQQIDALSIKLSSVCTRPCEIKLGNENGDTDFNGISIGTIIGSVLRAKLENVSDKLTLLHNRLDQLSQSLDSL